MSKNYRRRLPADATIIYDSRWVVRYYDQPEMKEARELYKFATGDAFITLEELQRDWDSWTRLDQVDFLHSFLSKPSLIPQDEGVLKFLCARFPIRPVHYTHWQERGCLSADFHPRY